MTIQPNETTTSYDLSELSFDQLNAMVADADLDVIEVLGYELVEKEALEGVPFIITKVIFRESDKNNVGFVSVEAVTNHNEKVVFNDSGTGIFKQLIALAEKQGVLLPNAAHALSENESLYSDYFDTDQIPFKQRNNVHVWVSTDGAWNIEWALGILKAKRGLRSSSYESREVDGQKIPGGTTWYLA